MKGMNLRKAGFIILAVLFSFSSCNFLNSFTDGEEKQGIEITGLTMQKSSLSVSVGEMSYISVSVRPSDVQKDVSLNWSFDENIIKIDASSWGATVTGVAEGQTSLKCSYGGYEATCVVNVSGFAENYEETAEPYIYSNTNIIQTSPGISEKVFVSLYGGTAQDIDGYTWTSDNASVASIEPSGQYCMITAKSAGYARIKITHTKAAYPYYMGVYVFEDPTNVSYITTGDNILTMNTGDDDRTVTVSLVNGSKDSSDSAFVWEVINDGSECPVNYETNGNRAVITPVKNGSCTLRVTHPDASYPLDILCRVITVVKNVYIEPDSTIITLDGEDEVSVISTLKNIDAGEYDIDAYEYALDDYNVAEITGYAGNEVILKGKANGSCHLLISHEKAAYTREVLLIVKGQLSDAIDASCYITTSQNYIRTKAGAEGSWINVSLKGGEEGDESLFSWDVKNTPAEENGSSVISMETTDGTVSSRAASMTYAYGKAFIEPLCEGTAVITVTHPKVLYPTEILVKVLGEDAILEEPLYFAGSGLLKIVNGQSAEYEVSLKGKNKTSSDDASIKWETDNNSVQIASSANTAVISAPPLGSGNTVSNITVSHAKADADKKILLLTADTEEELSNMKALYSDKLYYNIGVNEDVYLMTGYAGFDSVETKTDEDGNEYEETVSFDFSNAVWTVSDSSVCTVVRDSLAPLNCTVTALRAGTSSVTVSVIDGENKTHSLSYRITVYPEGAVQTEPEVYFTTSQNVINLKEPGSEAQVTVSAVALSSSKYSSIAWTSENADIASVISNGTSATVTARSEGETVISVTHEESQNTLKIHVRVGSEYVIQETDPVVYISAPDVITMLRDDPAQTLNAVLVNYTGTDKTGFKFTIDNENTAVITAQSTNGVAYVKPSGSGQAEITVTHPASSISKKVLVVVGNSSEELTGFTYLTTSSNVVAVGEGNTKTVSVSVKNSENIVIDGYSWSSSSPGVVSVLAQGNTAVLTGNSTGTAVITVTNKECAYPLQIIAQCVDPVAAAQSPYIQLTSSVLTVNISSSYTSVSADLVGGSEADFSDFVWSSADSSICVCFGQNEVGKLRALKEGTTYITVSHPKAAYSAQILVVCDEVKQSECYISVPASIISMKPTDSSQTITASLINGSATDKYNFTWSLDVYDVIDFVYSANVCTIEPKQQGQATITIHHPKAAYDQQIVVTVQEYTEFAFPNEYITVTQGNVSFMTMQIPNTKVSTYVKYSSAKEDICTVSGTKSTCQITAVSPGTTTLRAELIASSTGVVQASSEMMVYVKEAAVDACYITSTSTVYTIQKGKSQTLSASITGNGITEIDRQNLKWSTNDTDIISIAGISTDGTVTGSTVYLTAKAAGEALITCSHEKAASDLQFYVVVPGSGEKNISLNKSFITVTKGGSGTTLKATISNIESSNDYNDLIWSVTNISAGEDTQICRVMGSGQTVTVYPISVGEAEIMVTLPDSSSYAKCTVQVLAGKSFTFETSTVKVRPFETKKVKFTVSPQNANLTWTTSQTDEFFTHNGVSAMAVDKDGNGYVEISGQKEGSGNLYCVTDGGAKGNLSVKVSWDYEFSLTGKTRFTIKPTETAEIGYRVNPSYADITVDSTKGEDVFTYTHTSNGDGTGTILITPKTETQDEFKIYIKATNPNNNETIGEKEISACFQYDELTPMVTLRTQDGKFSKYEGGIIKLGDGEKMYFNIGIEEELSQGSISSVKFVPVNAGEMPVNLTFNSSDNTLQLADVNDDVIETFVQYRIHKLYVPYKYTSYTRSYDEPYGDDNWETFTEEKRSGKTYIDWQNDLKWRSHQYYSDSWSNKGWNDYFGLVQISTWNNSRPNSHCWYIYARDSKNGGTSLLYPIPVEDVITRPDDTDISICGSEWFTGKAPWGNYSFSKSVIWDIEEDPKWHNVVISEEEFKNYAWLYCPGTPSGNYPNRWVTYEDFENGTYSNGALGNGETVSVSKGSNLNNVSYSKEIAESTDISEKNITSIGSVEIEINHLGSIQPKKYSLPVLYSVRNCRNN